MSNVTIERMPTSSFMPRAKGSKYSDIFGLHGLFDKLYGKASLVLKGPKGVGKSLAFHSWALNKGIPMVTVDCSEDMRSSKLLGSFILRGNETPFILGAVPTAFAVANDPENKSKACILNFEELNALSPQAQKLLNSVLDFRRRVDVPEAGATYELDDGCTVWPVGSMNTAGYGGIHQLNEDLVSRIELALVDYPGPDDERQMLESTLPTTVLLNAQKMLSANTGKVTYLDAFLTLAKATRGAKGFDYALSPRDVVSQLTVFEAAGLVPTLQLTLGKFEGEYRTTLYKHMQSIFPGLKLPAMEGRG
jgi:MoxR-like ATPase